MVHLAICVEAAEVVSKVVDVLCEAVGQQVSDHSLNSFWELQQVQCQGGLQAGVHSTLLWEVWILHPLQHKSQILRGEEQRPVLTAHSSTADPCCLGMVC